MSEGYDIQLELKERVNYTEVIMKSIMNQKEVIKNPNFSLSKLHLMIIDDLFDIPSSWYDKQFANDIDNVVTTKTVPNSIIFAGVALSEKYMKDNSIPLTKEVKDINYFKLKLAIRNLLDRLNMLIRKDKIEASTGKNLEYNSLDDLIDSQPDDEDDESET